MEEPLRLTLDPNGQNLRYCAEQLKAGKAVAVPTETVYGLAANCLNTDAVRKIFEIKGRPLVDPLICHFSDTEAASRHVELNTSARKLAEAFWPGPLTLILPKKDSIPDLVTAGLPSAGVRVPAHPVFRTLLNLVDFPLAAPSANPFGYVSPTRAEHVAKTLGSRITAIIDGGPCSHGLESTILDLRTDGRARILRHGPIQECAIEQVLGFKLLGREEYAEIVRPDDEAQISPGRLTKHYSPNATVRLIKHNVASEFLSAWSSNSHEEAALVLQSRPKELSNSRSIYWLSEDGCVKTAAKNLFDLLQNLETKGYQEITIEKAAHDGLGIALNDRLQRAAAG